MLSFLDFQSTHIVACQHSQRLLQSFLFVAVTLQMGEQIMRENKIKAKQPHNPRPHQVRHPTMTKQMCRRFWNFVLQRTQ